MTQDPETEVEVLTFDALTNSFVCNSRFPVSSTPNSAGVQCRPTYHSNTCISEADLIYRDYLRTHRLFRLAICCLEARGVKWWEQK